MTTARDTAVTRYKDMLTVRRMMTALSSDFRDYNRSKTFNVGRAIDEVKARLTTLRSQQRDRSDDRLQSPKNFAKQTEAKIRSEISTLLSRRKFQETIVVGGADTGTCEYKKAATTYSKPTVTLCVGHMWLRNVFENFYKKNLLAQRDYIILSAVEYRTNVSNIRLFEAKTYGITEKKQVNGWIGQSKLGDQLCAFRTDKLAAIQVAQKLTLKSVNTQLNVGETS